MTHPESLPSLRVLYVVAHTHWDREWYHPAIRFQARLMALIDALLERAPGEPPFLLDGQAVVLADYLVVRPDRATDVRHAIRAGQIEVGPWFVLADNLIPSGEAIVRNLHAGRRWTQRFGADAPPLAYCPDTFGHPAAMPAIAAGFGFGAAIVWRGFGGAGHPNTDAFRWVSDDGSELVAFHLPPDGYEFGSALPDTPSAASHRWARIRDVLGARNTTGVSLLTVGADHHAPPANLSHRLTLLEAAAAKSGDTVRFEVAPLSEFARALSTMSDTAQPANTLPEVHGELRDSTGYTWSLQGTFATRAHQKRANALLERRLLRDVEPFSVLAWLHAGVKAREISPESVLNLAQLPTLIAHAWELLLRTHPHDTLCGCSVDAVADAMTARQRDVAALASELTSVALGTALRHDSVAARERMPNDRGTLVIRNRTGAARSGVAVVEIVEKVADVPVGPPTTRSGAGAAAAASSASDDEQFAHPTLQRLGSQLTNRRRESPQHYPDNDLVRVHRALAWIRDVPAFGVRVIDAADVGSLEAASVTASVSSRRRSALPTVTLDNGIVRLTANADGVRMHVGTRELSGALTLQTVADEGDTYTPSLRGRAESLTLHRIQLKHRGPLRASVDLAWRWRGADGQRIAVVTTLSLDAGSDIVRCTVRGDNARFNHRLQLRWHTDIGLTSLIMADAAFGPVDRTARPMPTDAHAVPFEQPQSTMPLHRWLSLSNDSQGATLLSDGLAEGEAIGGVLAVTLLRAVGDLSRNDLPERPGHAGWPVATPRAQCIGRFSATIGLLLHDAWSDETLVRIETAADTLLLPLIGETWPDLAASASAIGGPELHGHGLVPSTVQLSDDGRDLVLRCVNVTRATVRGSWTLPTTGDEWRAQCTRLDGAALDAWRTLPTGVLAFDVPARATMTFRVQRAGGV